MVRASITVGAAALAAFGFSVEASAESQLYLEGFAGWTSVADVEVDRDFNNGFFERSEIKSNLGYSLGGAIGYRFDRFRVEGEIMYLAVEADKGERNNVEVDIDAEASLLAGLVNANYDFNVGKKLSPFVGAGIGVASVSLDGDDLTSDVDDAVAAAFQLQAGLAYNFNDQMAVTGRYRYMTLFDPTFDDNNLNTEFEADVDMHHFLVGFRYGF